ncbi:MULTISPECIES: hypothetical protein [unclassified Streptomyces]|uniref:hypothetical protein n=1 Tax=unclassified Streptomyces TaxID=2593676 RepID=UPI00081D54A4|nr:MULTISPECIES: hypothetical protein [unclassified Streptomyces]MYZ34165.1 hypothetical protein [Streptomyces sp. SID4917]SCF64643.1 hypothetical protein GA0115259_100604 [Streptomyces sp. MnatMP-M17]
MSSLKNEALAACQVALAQLGFVKRGGAFLQERGGEAGGWIGLNLATHGLPRLFKINPVVGVRFAHLEKILLTLRDDVPKKPMPVISKPLGYLMPENSFRFWEFLEGGDIERVAKSLAGAVREYGEPYIATYSDWDVFSRDVGDVGLLVEHERAKVLPIVHLINGDREEARRIIESELERVASSGDMYAQSYRKFAEKFSGEFG